MGSPDIQPGIIRFGPFALDPLNRELRKRGYLVKLQPQQFAVLLLLTEHAGQIVSREEIHQHIWGNDTFVDFERGINFSINQIRGALVDDADKPRYVETIPRRGYRFICPLGVYERAEDQKEDGAHPNGRPSAKQLENLAPPGESLDSAAIFGTQAAVVPGAPADYRSGFSDGHVERITSLKGFRQFKGNLPIATLNVAPDGTPVLPRDSSTYEIYALNVKWP
jgi:DNA-binding winged helix-turn-helix (wHTH) protein